jgi:AraC-like DNA-binding protein
LADTDLPIAVVAESVGYRTHGNFFKAFKKLRGRTPNDFRASAQKDVLPNNEMT